MVLTLINFEDQLYFFVFIQLVVFKRDTSYL